MSSVDIKKIENFFYNLLTKTKENKIQWKIATKNEVVTLTFNADYIYRAFKVDLENSDKCFLILKKVPTYSEDFEIPHDVIDFSVYITSRDGHLIFELNDNYLPKSDLIRLYNLVAESNEQTKDFFSKY